MKELWAITLALPHEVDGLLPFFTLQATAKYRGAQVYEGYLAGNECVLVKTGMGPDRAEQTARFLFQQYPVSHLLSTGYCGGLREGMKNGEAVVADRVCLSDDSERGFLLDFPLVRRVESSLQEANIPHYLGTLVTSARPVLKPADKEELAHKTGAIAVDMESGAILRAAAAAGQKIASVCVRFIVDALGDELTDTGSFLGDDAEVKPLRLVREMFRRPRLLQELPDLGRKAGRARASMTQWVSRFFGVPSHIK